MESLESRVIPRTVMAPARYVSCPGEATRVYSAICAVLSGIGQEVNWSRFSPSDWNLMGRIAIRERVGPLLHAFWTRQDSGAPFSPELAAILAETYYQTHAYNALYFKRIRAIREVFAERHIPFVLFKGSALIPTLYGNPALRPMGDVDLLVPRILLNEAVAAVAELGFQEPGHLPSRRFGHHAHLRGGRGQCEAVEIHWSLGHVSWRLEARLEEWLWQNVEPCKLQVGPDSAGDRVLTLSPTAALSVIAAHQGRQHRVRRLLWLYDIHLLISKEKHRIDWQEAAARAEEFGWLGALQATLADAAYHFATVLPTHGRLAADTAQPIHQLQAIEIANPRPVALLRNLRRLRWKDRIRAIGISLAPSRQDMLKRYCPQPSFLWPLWYLVRWSSFGYTCLKTAPRILKSAVSAISVLSRRRREWRSVLR